MLYINRLLVITLMLSMIFAAPSIAEKPIIYDISNEFITSVCITTSVNNRYIVEIQLMDPRKLLQLTKDNIGKTLTVVFAGRVVISTVVKASIGSGTIGTGNFVSIHEAFELIEFIFANARNLESS